MMVSNRFYGAKILLGVGALVVLALHGEVGSRPLRLDVAACTRDPAPCVGVEMGVKGQVAKRLPDGFILVNRGLSLRFVGAAPDLVPGSHGEVVGRFLPSGHLQLVRYRHWGWMRLMKYGVSLLGLLGGLWYFLRDFRLQPGPCRLFVRKEG